MRSVKVWMKRYPEPPSTVACPHRFALPLLQSGVVRKVDVGHDNKFYALNDTTETFKAQVICDDCDRIFGRLSLVHALHSWSGTARTL